MRPIPLLSLAAEKCPTGCGLLDTFLHGGIPCGSLTELAGAHSFSICPLYVGVFGFWHPLAIEGRTLDHWRVYPEI